MAVAYVSYAGVKIPVWTSGADNAVARSGMRLDQVYRFSDTPDTNPLDRLPLPPRMKAPEPRGGVLWWPVGASHFARVHYVCDAAKLADIRTALIATAGSSTAGYPAEELVISDGRGGTDFTGDMHLLPPVPLLNSDELYLLTLVDERYWWWFKGPVDLSAVSTWSGMYSAIGTGLGVTVTIDGSVGAFAAPGARLKGLGNLPLPLLLDAAAWSTGRRIVRTPGGSVHAQDYATAKTAAAAVRAAVPATYRLRTGGQATDADVRKNAPASVVVRGAGTDQTVTLSSLAIADYSTVTGKAGYTYTLNVEAVSLSAGQAQAVATEWYQWLLADEDASYAGVSGFDPCGWWGAVEWSYRFNQGNPESAVTTRVLPFPLQLGHSAGGEPGGGSELNTQNTDGSEVEPNTTDLQFDKTTGSKITQSGGISTHTLLAASTTQMGAVTTSAQTFAGNKATTGGFISSAAGTALTAPYSWLSYSSTDANVQAVASSASVSAVAGTSGTARYAQDVLLAGGVGGLGHFCQHTSGDPRSAPLTTWSNGSTLGGFNAPLIAGANATNTERGIGFAAATTATPASTAVWDIYADTAEWSGGSPNSGPIRHRQNFLADSGSTHGGRRGGVDKLGTDYTWTVIAGDVVEIVAGHIITITRGGVEITPAAGGA